MSDSINLGLVFVTGLTTGGLSCLAVQAGLLATSVARQAETEVQAELSAKHTARKLLARQGPPNLGGSRRSRRDRRRHQMVAVAEAPPAPRPAVPPEPRRPRGAVAFPIALFLGSKVVAYTLLGLLLGWLGSVLQLTPYSRALLQLAIGVFMIGTALRLFNVHPIFRYFVIEPPRSVTRFIRRFAKNSEAGAVTAIFLGALTVLIPCGVTQAMMALAVGSGSPIYGALIMLSFTLGTTPVFFTLGSVATRLGKGLEGGFFKVAAVAVLILGLLSIESGLNLIGSPYSFTNLAAAITAPVDDTTQTTDQTGAGGGQASGGGSQVPTAVDGVLTVKVQNYGYSPNLLQAKAGEPLKLALATSGTTGCTRSFVVPALGIQTGLPETGTTNITLPPQPAGKLRFTCSMGMYSGQITFV
jgi:sulfite exporter TauE/SafE